MPRKGIKRCACGWSKWRIVKTIGESRAVVRCVNCGNEQSTSSARGIRQIRDAETTLNAEGKGE
jgi:hypothetical protein